MSIIDFILEQINTNLPYIQNGVERENDIYDRGCADGTHNALVTVLNHFDVKHDFKYIE